MHDERVFVITKSYKPRIFDSMKIEAYPTGLRDPRNPNYNFVIVSCVFRNLNGEEKYCSPGRYKDYRGEVSINLSDKNGHMLPTGQRYAPPIVIK